MEPSGGGGGDGGGDGGDQPPQAFWIVVGHQNAWLSTVALRSGPRYAGSRQGIVRRAARQVRPALVLVDPVLTTSGRRRTRR